jgi:hypothetical protein
MQRKNPVSGWGVEKFLEPAPLSSHTSRRSNVLYRHSTWSCKKDSWMAACAAMTAVIQLIFLEGRKGWGGITSLSNEGGVDLKIALKFREPS